MLQHQQVEDEQTLQTRQQTAEDLQQDDLSVMIKLNRLTTASHTQYHLYFLLACFMSHIKTPIILH